MGMRLGRSMGEKACERTGSGPALYRERVLIMLAMMIDPVRPRALAGLLAVAHEHDGFWSFVMICHVTPSAFFEGGLPPCLSRYVEILHKLAVQRVHFASG